MKAMLVVLFAVVASACAASTAVQAGKSSDLADIDPTSENGAQIPVQVVLGSEEDAAEASPTLRRQKRFLLTKLLLAKAAVGAG